MKSLFNEESTTDDVLKGINLEGKRVLITGASGGIGLETARFMAAHGADILCAVRDMGKARNTMQVVRDTALMSGSCYWLVNGWRAGTTTGSAAARSA